MLGFKCRGAWWLGPIGPRYQAYGGQREWAYEGQRATALYYWASMGGRHEVGCSGC